MSCQLKPMSRTQRRKEHIKESINQGCSPKRAYKESKNRMRDNRDLKDLPTKEKKQ